VKVHQTQRSTKSNYWIIYYKDQNLLALAFAFQVFNHAASALTLFKYLYNLEEQKKIAQTLFLIPTFQNRTMLRMLALAVLLFCFSIGRAQRIFDAKGYYKARIEDHRFFDDAGRLLGYAQDGQAFDRAGLRLGRMDSKQLYDGKGRPVGRIDGKYFYDGAGKPLGRIEVNQVFDRTGKPLLRSENVEPNELILFLYFYLPLLEQTD
jgi:hypothetical protein